MKEFEPSRDFVARVMRAVVAAETVAGRTGTAGRHPATLPALRAALAAGGGLLGILNLLRLWFSVFFPQICQ